MEFDSKMSNGICKDSLYYEYKSLQHYCALLVSCYANKSVCQNQTLVILN
jgi:hypothetical protein